MTLNILLDCDGVIANFTEAVCDHFKITRGCQVTPEDIKSYDIETYLGEANRKAFPQVVKRKGFCEEIPWYKGARQFVKDLQAYGNVRILTAPWQDSPHWYEERAQWLERFFDIKKEDIIFCSSETKRLVHSDILIEDNEKTILQWLNHNPKGTAILRRRPWNRLGLMKVWDDNRLRFAESFEDIVKNVNDIDILHNARYNTTKRAESTFVEIESTGLQGL